MENEVMDLQQLAAYLHRDVREVSKLANRGYLPGKKVGGQWRFASSEINYWIETQMHAFTETELAALEQREGKHSLIAEPLVSSLLAESTVAVPLAASTKASVLKELVNLAEQSWQIYDPSTLLDAVKHREDLGTTALDGGVVIPHPMRPLSTKLQGDAVIAFGRTGCGVPFGAPDGGLTDLFFLVSCRDANTHLRVLARLSRLMMRPGFLNDLRAAESGPDALRLLERSERDLVE
jgi:PTS system nitrogen regulatory IIA component